MRVLDFPQGSKEWHDARRGVITSTKAQNIFDTTKTGKPTAKQAQQIAKLAMERLNGESLPGASGAAIRRGHEFEDDARTAYIFLTMKDVTQCGMILHDNGKWGCSPDGNISDNGCLEIKVPTDPSKHVEYLKDPNELIAEYGHQCYHTLFIGQYDYLDICSYHPEAPPGLQIARKRILKPYSWAKYEARLIMADKKIEELKAELQEIQKKGSELC